MKTAIPRTRGGDPARVSLRARHALLFPAHAGVILGNTQEQRQPESIPRTRGGDPEVAYIHTHRFGYSPHTRG